MAKISNRRRYAHRAEAEVSEEGRAGVEWSFSFSYFRDIDTSTFVFEGQYSKPGSLKKKLVGHKYRESGNDMPLLMN